LDFTFFPLIAQQINIKKVTDEIASAPLYPHKREGIGLDSLQYLAPPLLQKETHRVLDH
jgi:hypothetical protein